MPPNSSGRPCRGVVYNDSSECGWSIRSSDRFRRGNHDDCHRPQSVVGPERVRGTNIRQDTGPTSPLRCSACSASGRPAHDASVAAPAFQSDIPPRSMGLRVCGVLAPSAPANHAGLSRGVHPSGRPCRHPTPRPDVGRMLGGWALVSTKNQDHQCEEWSGTALVHF